MKKQIKSPLWLRLLPGILLISIPIIWLIYAFVEHWGSNTDSSDYFIALSLLLIFTGIILSTIVVLFPFAGGILSLLLLLFLLVPNFPDNFSDIDIFSIFNIFSVYILSVLLLAGITGVYVGVWNFRYRKHSVSSVNPQDV